MKPFLRLGYTWGFADYDNCYQISFHCYFPRMSRSWKRLFKRPAEGERCLGFQLLFFRITREAIEDCHYHSSWWKRFIVANLRNMYADRAYQRGDVVIDRREALARESVAEITMRISQAPDDFFINFTHNRQWERIVEGEVHRAVHSLPPNLIDNGSAGQLKSLIETATLMEVARHCADQERYLRWQEQFITDRQRLEMDIEQERMRRALNEREEALERRAIRVEPANQRNNERARLLEDLMNAGMRPGQIINAEIINELLRHHGAEHLVENKKSIRTRKAVRVKALRQCKKALDPENYERIKKLEPIVYQRPSGNPGYSVIFTVMDPKNKHSMIHYKGVAIECRCCIQVTDDNIPAEEIALLKYLITKHKEDYMWKTSILHEVRVKPGFGNSEIDPKEMINIPLYELKILANKDGLREMNAQEDMIRRMAMEQLAMPALAQQDEMNRMARQMGQAARQQMGGLLGQILGGR